MSSYLLEGLLFDMWLLVIFLLYGNINRIYSEQYILSNYLSEEKCLTLSMNRRTVPDILISYSCCYIKWLSCPAVLLNTLYFFCFLLKMCISWHQHQWDSWHFIPTLTLYVIRGISPDILMIGSSQQLSI